MAAAYRRGGPAGNNRGLGPPAPRCIGLGIQARVTSPFAFRALAPTLAMMPSPSSASSRPAAGDPPIACAVCGTPSQQPPFRPDPPEQAPDLDLRPGEPVRGTMARWLQQCPHCGYAAPSIAKAHPAAAQAVAAAPFRALLAETAHPPLARRFLAWAHVLEETGALHAAAEASLQAAWVADDLHRADLARLWRQEAVALWRAGPRLDAEQTVRVVDALRRAGAFDDAEATAQALARSGPPEAVAQVIALELRLIEAGDLGRHTVATALPPPARRPHVSHQRLRVSAPGESLFSRLRRFLGGR
jgi:hypothetical protein